MAFFTDTSAQTIDVHRDENGLEWPTLRKSPTGEPGSSKLVAYEEEAPFVTFV